MYIFYIEKT